MADVQVFDSRACSLGEGPLWHPTRNEFFWFDINSYKLMAEGGREWAFESYVSAAGWLNDTEMMVAGDRSLMLFNIDTGAHEDICPLEADQPLTRSNDGRADPYGGFWIGTMPAESRDTIGAIYRYYRGEVRQLVSGIVIPNAICFSPDGLWAYWTNTGRAPIYKQRLSEKDGWPVGEPEIFNNPVEDGWRPDGAVIAADGTMWNAQYGGCRIAHYDTDGAFLDAIDIPARATTCPAFGGPNLDRLFCTSATQGMDDATLAEHPLNGQTFVVDGMGPGQAEHQVIL